MRVFVAGSTGRVATELIKELTARGYKVLAGARKPEAVIAGEGVTAIKMDLHQDVAELEKLLENVDAVIFTAGSRGKDLLQVDAFGAVKLMQACQKMGIKRFVMLSALFSLEPESWSQIANLSDYYVAKYFADNYLVHQSGLDYTVIQPGRLLEEAGSGQISLEKKGMTDISISDVAAVLAEVLDKPSTYKKVFEIHPGKTAITKVFQ